MCVVTSDHPPPCSAHMYTRTRAHRTPSSLIELSTHCSLCLPCLSFHGNRRGSLPGLRQLLHSAVLSCALMTFQNNFSFFSQVLRINTYVLACREDVQRSRQYDDFPCDTSNNMARML